MARLEIPSSDFVPELVRGAVKVAMKNAGAKSADLWNVPPDKLRVIPGFNGRIRTPAYEAHVETVTQSIIENGYYPDKPLAGYVAKEDDEDVIYVTEGHTRFEAVRNAAERGHVVEFVPVVIKPNGTSMEDLTIALVTSNDGRPFTPYEKALMVKRLIGMGLDVPTIAKRLTMTEKYVNDLLTLAGAPKAVRDLVVAEKVAPTLAIAELTKHGGKAAERLKAAVEKAAASGKKKATAKHVEGGKKARKVSAPDESEKREIDAQAVLADARQCGFAVGQIVDVDDKLIRFAATLLDRFGITVYQIEQQQQAEDPAADL